MKLARRDINKELLFQFGIYSCFDKKIHLVTLVLVGFNLPLPSDNRLAKLILRSEASKYEKTLYLAEHYWYTIVDP